MDGLQDDPWYYWFTTKWGIVFMINAVCGLVLFEVAWCRTHRFRHSNKELD
jgi:hypothetical protein